jgi:protein tyrosine phosphatase (PTP) superfamily phosphohydrolase (DUF442 family)
MLLACSTLGLVSGRFLACISFAQDPTQAQPAIRKLDVEYLANAIQIHPRVITGGEPDGERAFESLSQLGIKTIISVDGAKPNIELASQFGMRYFHLPHGYNGIPHDRILELAKAVRDLDGPIYFHCHHGKHRSPTAAVVACVANGLIHPTQTLDVLQLAGTGKNYLGLFETALSAGRIDDSILAGLKVEFHPIANVQPMAETMVLIDQSLTNLNRLSNANWRSRESPELDATHEALMLAEHFSELLRLPTIDDDAEGFRKLIHESESECRKLELMLRKWNPTSSETTLPTEAVIAMKKITANCTACHQNYRDTARMSEQTGSITK